MKLSNMKLGQTFVVVAFSESLPVEIKQGYEFLSSAEQERYQKFFKEKMDKYGVDSPAELSEEKKKDFFNEIQKDWK